MSGQSKAAFQVLGKSVVSTQLSHVFTRRPQVPTTAKQCRAAAAAAAAGAATAAKQQNYSPITPRGQ